MLQFQGSGFSLALPEDCIDGSQYTFVLPEKNGFSASILVRFQLVFDGFSFESFVNEQKELAASLSGFSLLNQAQGKRDGCDGAMFVYEWGEGEGRFRQKQVLMRTQYNPERVYLLTTTDLVNNAEYSDAVFDQILRSFTPNEQQLW